MLEKQSKQEILQDDCRDGWRMVSWRMVRGVTVDSRRTLFTEKHHRRCLLASPAPEAANLGNDSRSPTANLKKKAQRRKQNRVGECAEKIRQGQLSNLGKRPAGNEVVAG